MTGIVGWIALVLDIGMLIVGAWALAKGSLPARPFKTLLGDGDYRTDSRTARFFGSLLIAPFVFFILAVVWTMTASEQVAIIFSAIHFIVLILVVLTGVMWARRIRSANKASR